MTTTTDMPVKERILQLLQHLGVLKAHFAAGGSDDWVGLVEQHPDLVASLTLVNPPPLDSNIVGPLASRLLVFHGDSPAWDEVGESVAAVPGATLEILKDWKPWSDLITRHEPEIAPVLLPFLSAKTPVDMPTMPPTDDHGAVAEISYQIKGSGPPVILFPLGFVPSQWEALIPALNEAYCTITLGGAQLGTISLLERRAQVPGYVGMVRHLLQEAGLAPGHSILEVGCGTGALIRWLAHYTGGANSITGIDISRFMLHEAANLARMEGLGGSVTFEEGDAENLAYSDNSFDLTFSSTVLEEVNADKALAEMIRVTRPGGRVAIIVRAMDAPFFMNLPLQDQLKAKVEDSRLWGGSAGPEGCDDVSLYRRFKASSLTDIKMFPYWVVFGEKWLDFAQATVMPTFDAEETAEWQEARSKAETEGTFFFTYPHHCAVGTVREQH